MFIARTCSQHLSPSVVKEQWLVPSHIMTSGKLPWFQSPSVHGNLSQIMVVRWTSRDHTMQTHRGWICFKKNPSNDGDKCVQFNQTARKKRNDCVRDPVTNKKTLTTTQSNLLSSIKAAKCSSRDHTTQRKHWWTLALFFFFAEKETGDLPPCDSKLLRGRLAHIMVVWCSPQDHTMQQQDERLLSCTHKTTEQNATMQPSIQRKRLTSVKANGVYHKTTLCKYRNDPRWHLFTIKKTPCQPNSCANVLQKSWWCGLFSSRNFTRKCRCF